MKFEVFVTGPIETNTYLVYAGMEAIVIDPGLNCANAINARAKELKLEIKFIINTHGHWDHITDNYALQNLTGAKIVCGSGDEQSLAAPSDLGWRLPFKLQASRADVLLKDGDEIKISAEGLRVISTPGHTPGSICLYSKESKIVFTGDTLFAGAMGRTDFPGGDALLIKKSLKKLAKLPPETKVLPGHGEFTLIKKEKEWI